MWNRLDGLGAVNHYYEINLTDKRPDVHVDEGASVDLRREHPQDTYAPGAECSGRDHAGVAAQWTDS